MWEKHINYFLGMPHTCTAQLTAHQATMVLQKCSHMLLDRPLLGQPLGRRFSERKQTKCFMLGTRAKSSSGLVDRLFLE